MLTESQRLTLRATAARAQVERILRGARPRHLAQRFRDLRRPAREPVVIITMTGKPGELVAVRTPTRLSIAARAGLLRQTAREAQRAEEARS